MTEASWRWQWLPDQGEGVEEFGFHVTSTGLLARGRVVAMLEGAPLDASYQIEADAAWTTRSVRVEVKDGASLDIRSNGAGRWRHADGRAIPELDGCIDPDVSMTPFTNTLPIRRLGLRAGEAAEIRVAYILVPDLSLRAAPQRYTRLADRHWRFEGLDIDFSAEITVDEEGFVIEYPGLFRRGR